MSGSIKNFTKAKRKSKYDRAVKCVNKDPAHRETPNGLLRDVKQDPYPDICALTEKEAKRRVEITLGLKPPLWGRKCYACKAPMVCRKIKGGEMVRETLPQLEVSEMVHQD